MRLGQGRPVVSYGKTTHGAKLSPEAEEVRLLNERVSQLETQLATLTLRVENAERLAARAAEHAAELTAPYPYEWEGGD